jgi:hypothetical protein
MIKMAIKIVVKGVDIHKWASLEKTQVFPVKPLFNLVFIRIAIALLFIGMGILLHYIMMWL